MLNIVKSKKGLSLVELIAVSAILVTITVVTGSVFLYGYQGYYQENDTMLAELYAMQTMQTIMDDLRKYEDQTTKAEGNILTIKQNPLDPQDPNNVIYTYQANNILKNGVKIADIQDMSITNFTVAQRTQDLDSKIIDISFTVTFGQAGTRTVSSSYRCKIAS